MTNQPPKLAYRFHKLCKNESAPGGAVRMYEIFEAATGKTFASVGLENNEQADDGIRLIIGAVNAADSVGQMLKKMVELTQIKKTSRDVERVAESLCGWRNGKRSDAVLETLPRAEQDAYREQAIDALEAMGYQVVP